MEIKSWDWIAAVDIIAINKKLAFQQPLSSFNSQGKSGLLAENVTFAGKFGSWSVSGGVGDRLYLSLPITSGNMSVVGTSTRTVDFSGSVFVISTMLSFSSLTPSSHDLQFLFGQGSAEGQAPTGSEVGIQSFTAGAAAITGADSNLAGYFLVQDLIKNAAQIPFIFASTLNVATSDKNSWLGAKFVAYGVSQTSTSAPMYLCIGGSTSAASQPSTEVLVDPVLISTKPEAALIVTAAIFSKYVVAPNVPSIGGFPKGVSSTKSSTSVTLTTDHIEYKASKSCEIDGFLGIKVASPSCSISEKWPVGYDAAQDTITIGPDPSPIITSSANVSVLESILSGVLSGIGFGSMGALLSVLSESIGISIPHVSPTASIISLNFAHGSAFKPSEAGLNDAFYMRGTLV
jgi:hypothetical protein